MKTPWLNYKKMLEITSTQKNCICSSKVYSRSRYLEIGERNFRQIYITNSLGVQIKFINRCLTRLDIEEIAKKNNSKKIVQNEQYPKSFANTEVDQLSKVNQVDENQKEEKLTDSPELQINPVNDSSYESINNPAHDTNNDFKSTITNEDHEAINHEEYNGDQSEQYPESFINTEVDQFHQANQADENQRAEKLTDSPELQINPVGDASSESINISAHDTNTDFITDGDHETLNHEGYNVDQNEQYPESFANTEVDQFHQANQVDENQKEEKLTDSPELRINPVGDASSESINISAHDTNNDSESTITDEDH